MAVSPPVITIVDHCDIRYECINYNMVKFRNTSTYFILPSGVYRMGINPNLCAMYSSFKTLEFSAYSTKSMAIVGTSAIIIRRKALAILVSVSESMNEMAWGAMERTSTLGKRCWGMIVLFPYDCYYGESSGG